MKRTNTYNQFSLIFFLLSATLFFLPACSDENNNEAGTLSLSDLAKVVDAKKGEISIEVISNTDWKIGKIDENANWLNVFKKEEETNFFIISYDKNEKIENRETEFYVVTADGKGFQKFHFTQLGDNPLLILDENKLDVVSRARTHRVNIETNIPPNLIEKEIIYDGQTNEGWILGLEMKDGTLSFKTERNLLNNDRKATIILSFKDESVDNEDVWSELDITQMSSLNDVPPEIKDFTYAKSLALGEIEENISIVGNMVMETPSHNFRPGTKTYIIQDENNKAIVLEAMEDLTFAAYDRVQLLLDGAEMTTYNDAGFNYQVIKGITKGSIIEQVADPSFMPKEMYMKDLTDDYLLSLVTLKDVEFAIPYGGFTNINEGYLKDDHTKTYPHPIRDINGDYMYMLTNREVSYRKQPVPKGSGNLTGIIVRASELCYGDIGEYSIRQLKKEHVNLAADRNIGFSNVLVEWNCQKPTNFVEGMKHIAPQIGSQNTVLQKYEATGFFGKYGTDNRVYFLPKYRGDATNGTIANGGYVSTKWGTNQYWLIDNISTIGVTKPLSLQIEVNSSTNDGPRDYTVEYSLDGENWLLVENYTVHGQISGTVKIADVIPGFKMYNFNLPEDMLGKSNVKVRLRNTSMTRVDGQTLATISGTGRLVHLSIKYNK